MGIWAVDDSSLQVSMMVSHSTAVHGRLQALDLMFFDYRYLPVAVLGQSDGGSVVGLEAYAWRLLVCSDLD